MSCWEVFPFVINSYLVLLPVDLVNRIAVFLIDHLSYRRVVFGRTHFLHTSISISNPIRSTTLEQEEDSHNAPHTS
jgi:hypothetical protein